MAMAYPEPIPALNAKEAREFQRNLAKFKLTPKQKEFYREMRAKLKKSKKK
jgi:hypothetical protein